MPPISRTQVAPVLKAKDYAESWDCRRAEPAVTCHNSSLYMGVKMVTHTGSPFYGESLRTRVRFPPPPLHKSNGYTSGTAVIAKAGND